MFLVRFKRNKNLTLIYTIIQLENLLYKGQWQGFFSYGNEYGTIVSGQEAEFRLFIEKFDNGEFSGRVIDWDGFGVDGEISKVKGFIEGDIISFIKEYDKMHIIDDFGNCSVQEGVKGYKVVYEGRYNKDKNYFEGDWEIVYDLFSNSELIFQEKVTGKWRMYRN